MGDQSYDIVVIGAGILGLAHAYCAAQAGKRVAVVERGIQARGASTRNFGMVWPVGQPPGEMRQIALRSRAKAVQFESEGGERWEQCAAWFKTRAERRRGMSETFYRRVMEQWESIDGRAEIVLEFLSETQPEAVPSFWEWDASTNPTPFSKEGTNL